MLNRSWSWSDVHQQVPVSHLDEAIKALGDGIVDDSAKAALQTLFQHGWFYNSEFWHLSAFAVARLLQSPLRAEDPSNATLVLINGNTSGACRYLAAEQEAHVAPYQRHHFSVVPYGHSRSIDLLSEYWINDPYRSQARYARGHDHDIIIPYLTEVSPSGPSRLSDLSILYTKPRRWLVSFVGSVYRPGEPEAFLTKERYAIMRALTVLNHRFMTKGSAAFSDHHMRALLDNGVLETNEISNKQLLVMPLTPFPETSGMNDKLGLRAVEASFGRQQWTPTGGSMAPVNKTDVIKAYLIHASSIFSLQLPGDGPVRTSQIHALVAGSIPVIVDWQVEAVAALFQGILFQTKHRFEDIFVILDRQAAHTDPEYVFRRLLDIVVNGEHRQRQARIRDIVDFMVYRRDNEHEDALSLLLDLLAKQRLDLLNNSAPLFHKVKEWPHHRPLPSAITKAHRPASKFANYLTKEMLKEVSA
eukprot:TRINITY_DN7545_c0_g1_i1.p1 TRINITY_DN7545_c0_g1~~TRINITY_DN7545_c0_g1_i1.p1  ORF type:complete len:473 (+),score=70.69 TRINITY_DN7545_c0_g1_i1:567-1985(+)